MLPDLAPELWAQILAFLPYTSLPRATRVNRVFHQICKDRIFGFLDLVPTYTDDNVDEQLELMKKRLRLAKPHAPLIKKLRFIPLMLLPMSYALKDSQSKPIRFLSRILGKSQAARVSLSSGHSSAHPSYQKAREVDSILNSLLPSLKSLEELDICAPPIWYEVWGPNAHLAMSMAAPQLTTLVLHYHATAEFFNHHYNNNSGIVLPVLRTLKLFLGTWPNCDYERRVRELISGSPLLTDIEYHLTIFAVDAFAALPVAEPPTHPRLKVFKWTAICEAYDLLPSLGRIFESHAPHFNVVYLNPAPSLGAVQALDLGHLVELRVNLNACDDGVEFFTLIARAKQLVTLEVTGFRYSNTETDPANLFPATGLDRLKVLYLGIALELFSAQTLKTLASKTRYLSKLALIAEPWNNSHWTPDSLQTKCKTLSNEFQASTDSNSLSEWSILDFGILFRDWSGGITDFEGVLLAISQRVPSIASLYGTGHLNVLDGMENDINEAWGGELWKLRRPGWSCDPI